MKKTYSLLFALTACALFTQNSNSSEVKAQQKSSKDILLEAGFIDEDIASLSDFTLDSLATQVQEHQDLTYQVFKLNESYTNSSVETFGEITTEDLTVILTLYNERTINDCFEVCVRLYYDWNKLPTWRLEDPVIISWDSDVFEYKEGTFNHEDHYYRNGKDTTYMSGSAMENNLNTLVWKAALKTGYFLGIGGKITKLYGFGEFYLKSFPYVSHIDTYVKAKYVHSLTANAQVNVKNSLGYSLSGSHDSASRNGTVQHNI